ncbi:hypothetical protein LX32DRAFT_192263 [Colletotrichum zoysiae]|uniref:Uncharacterized protein n=1 Tax=Colletotrichum zoysiae TaxID=1216348 RepID=A0AAD9H6G4_9PEZI|nr:hypothetical protein LX32DRAFT_192263 [Colletotrichum zoysiae]
MCRQSNKAMLCYAMLCYATVWRPLWHARCKTNCLAKNSTLPPQDSEFPHYCTVLGTRRGLFGLEPSWGFFFFSVCLHVPRTFYYGSLKKATVLVNEVRTSGLEPPSDSDKRPVSVQIPSTLFPLSTGQPNDHMLTSGSRNRSSPRLSGWATTEK